jgi:hypothetical protein
MHLEIMFVCFELMRVCVNCVRNLSALTTPAPGRPDQPPPRRRTHPGARAGAQRDYMCCLCSVQWPPPVRPAVHADKGTTRKGTLGLKGSEHST